MKAAIRALTKKYLPHPITGEPALHVAAEVDFLDDAGRIVHSQLYAHLPENTRAEYYQEQADVMQNDLDLTAQWTTDAEKKAVEEKTADDAIAAIGQHYKLNFHEEVPINDVES